MMKQSKILSVLCLSLLSACSQIKAFFPDKERDYLSSAEILPLSIPVDLADNTAIDPNELMPAPLVVETTQPAIETPVIAELPPAQDLGSINDLDSIDNDTDIVEPLPSKTVKFLHPHNAATRLQLNQSFQQSWRIVGKALSHNAIEIIDQNRAEGVYYVQYDPNEYEVKDGSIWDEVTFLFGTNERQEQEYRIWLGGVENITEVLVLNDKDKPVIEDAGLQLLTQLYETIKADFSDE